MADEIENQKRALLTAIAQQGAQGREQFAQNQASLEQGRTGSMGASFARSDAIHAPQPLNTALGTQAAQPFDTALRDQQVAQLAYGQQLGGINAINNNYMSQLAAARPVVSSITDSQIARIRAQQEQEAADRADRNKYAEEDRQWTREQRDWSRQDHQAKSEQDQIEQNAKEQGDKLTTDVNSRQSPQVRDTYNQAISQYGSKAEAMAALSASADQIRNDKKLKQADKDAQLRDLEAARQYVGLYFDIWHS